ncbi:C-terminal binding protein [Sorangium atrum]|uniref:C-terminal binding protein n=1 Tax=Sorangium atrum TaxID=2995308 RepID=A0ABT5BYL6_9BACT|nr:C-terminal binding protein [Sorangium aterium]MDC0678843.1 C-terminal binding protein [Sorangium aterium]
MSMERTGPVVVLDYDFGDIDVERSLLEPAGFEVVAAQCKTEEDVAAAAHDAVGVLTQYAEVKERAISGLRRCRVIARYGTGVDTVDVAAATRRGIRVTNAPNDWCADEVADHAVALLLTLARKLPAYDRATRRGSWSWQDGRPIHRIRGATLGLLSFGAIARGISARMASFGARIMTHDPFLDPDEIRAAGAAPVPFGELLERSDYLVLQAPLTTETRGLIGERELRRMKPTAILVNTARGPIIDDSALYRALKEGWIAGAGLDDIAEEPAKRRDWKPTSPLLSLDNVVITPHAAYYSDESIEFVRRFAANEIVRVLSGQEPMSPVNLMAA